MYILNKRKSHSYPIDGAVIAPFAQEEVVSTFIEGVDPSLLRDIEDTIKGVIDALPTFLAQNILGQPLETKKSQIDALCNMLIKRYKMKINEYIRKTHINPVLYMLDALPKDEIGAMAEALVNLTSFRRRVTTDEETVGGPIDVAVITKGDGFVWIKRKHYFEASLNHHFFTNYYR